CPKIRCSKKTHPKKTHLFLRTPARALPIVLGITNLPTVRPTAAPAGDVEVRRQRKLRNIGPVVPHLEAIPQFLNCCAKGRKSSFRFRKSRSERRELASLRISRFPAATLSICRPSIMLVSREKSPLTKNDCA